MTRILTLANNSDAVPILDELKQRVCIYCKRFSDCQCGHLRCLEIWEESKEFNFKCENFKEKPKKQQVTKTTNLPEGNMDKSDLIQYEYYYVQDDKIDEIVCTAKLLDFIDDEICIMESNGILRKVPINMIIKKVVGQV